MSAEELIKNIDWSELRNQKKTLQHIINDGFLPDEEPKDDLMGLLHLIDSLQDYACDELNIPSIHIYDFEDEENMEKVEVLLNKNRKPMESGDVLIPVKDDKTVEVKQLDDVNWEGDEKKFLMSIINRYGDGQHPDCDEQTFNYFQVEYVKEIVNNEEIPLNLNHSGRQLLKIIKFKLLKL